MSAPHDDLLALAEALPGWDVRLEVNALHKLVLVSVVDARASRHKVTIRGYQRDSFAIAYASLLVEPVERQQAYLTETEILALRPLLAAVAGDP